MTREERETAVRVCGDRGNWVGLARIIYQEQCGYVGPDHEGVCVEQMAMAFRDVAEAAQAKRKA